MFLTNRDCTQSRTREDEAIGNKKPNEGVRVKRSPGVWGLATPQERGMISFLKVLRSFGMKNNLGNKSKVLGITFETMANKWPPMDKDKPVYVLGGKNFLRMKLSFQEVSPQHPPLPRGWHHSNLLNFRYERQMLEESAQIIRRHRTKRTHPGKLAYLVHEDTKGTTRRTFIV